MESQQQYHEIGKGSCGSVWASEENQALKREDGSPDRSLQNDHDMHRRVLEALSSAFNYYLISKLVAIPKVHDLIQAEDRWWDTREKRFPAGRVPCRSLLTERIPHFPTEFRDRLIDQFCPSTLAEFVKSNPADKHCLVRAYLGRRRQPASNSMFQRFSLRNYPLHIDQMEVLGLNITNYAQCMGNTLAVMHWGAHVDANDVEYVLAPTRSRLSGITLGLWSEIFQSPYLGDHTIWVLDFDCCKPMSMDEEGVNQACEAFYKNDPFYPRLDQMNLDENDLANWQAFRDSFMASSKAILPNEDFWLAELLVKRLEEEGESRRKKKEEIISDPSSA